MQKNKINTQKGMTLVEMLVTIFIFTTLMSGVVVLFRTVFTTSTQKKLAIDTADEARKIAFNFTNEIRTATIGSDGSYPLNQAGDTQIILYSGYGASSGLINRIRYFASGAALYKGTITPTGNPLAYDTNAEVVRLVQTGLANGATPLFYYYNDNYAGTSTSLAQPINLNSVKFVKINLILLKQDVKNAATTFSVNAGATIRSLKTNLGS